MGAAPFLMLHPPESAGTRKPAGTAATGRSFRNSVAMVHAAVCQSITWEGIRDDND